MKLNNSSVSPLVLMAKAIRSLLAAMILQFIGSGKHEPI